MSDLTAAPPGRDRGRSIALAGNPRAGGRRGAARWGAAQAPAGEGRDPRPGRHRPGDAGVRSRVAAAVSGRRDAPSGWCGGDGTVHLGCRRGGGDRHPLGGSPRCTGNDVAAGARRAAGRGPRWPPSPGPLRRRPGGGRRCRRAGAGDAGARWLAGVFPAGSTRWWTSAERLDSWRWPRGRRPVAPWRCCVSCRSFRQRDYVLELDGRSGWRTSGDDSGRGFPAAYGGGMRVGAGRPAATGLLDVLVAGAARPRGGVRARLPAGVLGRARGRRPPAPRQAGPGGSAAGRGGVEGYADGERVGPLPLDCECVPGALRLLGTGERR